MGRLTPILAGAVLLALAAPASAEFGLLHACIDSNPVGRNTLDNRCTARAWLPAQTPDVVVLSCPTGTRPEDCRWGHVAMTWQRFDSLPDSSFVNVCTVDIPPGPFGPPDRPVVDPACGDPCGCGNSLDRKANVTKISLQGSRTVSNQPRVSWVRPTANVDGTELPASEDILYTVYRRLPNSDSFAQLAQTRELELRLPPQPPGEQCFSVTARRANGDGQESDKAEACVRVRLPAPTGGRIEAPSNGRIE